MSSTALAAVLFDMDGLLVDTEPQWFAAESRTMSELGGEWARQQHVDLLGSNLAFAAKYMIEAAGSSRSVPDVMAILLGHATDELAQGVTFQPGALQLVDQLDLAGVPMGLVTSSVRAHVDVVLQHIPNAPFAHTVTADDVTNLKPHPEPYLAALELLGVPASSTVVLEDSPTGVMAAEAAGCHVVAVPNLVGIDAAPCRQVWPSLVGIDVRRLQNLITPS